jgi:hypothetical protein
MSAHGVLVLLAVLGERSRALFSIARACLTWAACAIARYDSVIGEVGVDLNYDELVTYTDASALPCKIIVYRVRRDMVARSTDSPPVGSGAMGVGAAGGVAFTAASSDIGNETGAAAVAANANSGAPVLAHVKLAHTTVSALSTHTRAPTAAGVSTEQVGCFKTTCV